MEYTELGDTGIEISRICFGCWQFGGDWTAFDEAQAKASVDRALELGVNVFDTAQAYGWGRSERLLGEALEVAGRDREEVVIATKGGLRPRDGSIVRDSSEQWLREGLRGSLKNLGVDYVDVYQVHWPDLERPFEEVAETMASLKEEGLVRAIGVSNYDVDQLALFEQGADLDTLQPPYHLLRRDAEASILPYGERNGVGVLTYGALAHGLLTGKYGADATFADDDWRSGNPWFQGLALKQNAQVVDELASLADDLGTDVTRLATAWVLDHPAVDAAIVGARRPGHIEGTAPAVELDLDGEALERIDRILEDAVPMGGATPEMV